MLDREIPFFNTILKSSSYQPTEIELPEGFSIVSYHPGYEMSWAELECSVGDFASVDEARRYFVSTYLKEQDAVGNILFLQNGRGDIVGSCIAWQDERKEDVVSSLHWLVVKEEYQGQGLGRALCCAVMNIFSKRNAFPVYIHTQPWSWKAILLYISLGFRLQKTDTFSHYVNQYGEAMETLKELLSEEQYKSLVKSSEE